MSYNDCVLSFRYLLIPKGCYGRLSGGLGYGFGLNIVYYYSRGSMAADFCASARVRRGESRPFGIVLLIVLLPLRGDICKE